MTVAAPTYRNVLDELLLCLAGFSGDVFLEPEAPGAGPGAILNDLARLGHYFRGIRAFIEEEAGSFAVALERAAAAELLDVYRAKLLDIQHLVMGSATPALSRLQYLLSDFQMLLPEVHALLCEVQLLRRQNFKGSELVALLHTRARGGAPLLQSCMARLLWHCNQVLLKQLSSWMVHGLLLDPFEESFIVQTRGASLAAPQQQQQQQQPIGSSNVAHDEWHTVCKVDLAALPLYISPELANTILFVGKAVRLLKQPTGVFAGQELLSNRDTLEFVQALQKLQQQDTFQRVKFEHTVEAIRSKVAAVLWQLVVVQADLMGHLSAIKDYFLLAKGDFYHNFLVEARSLMSLPPRPSFADADVAVPFQHSALKSTAQHDRLFHLFRMRWSSEELKGEAQRLDNWDNLYLEYQVEWPMGLLFTLPVIARYNALFQFLMRLKRVQLKLEAAWQSLHALYTHARASGAAVPVTAGASTSALLPATEGSNARLKQLHLIRHHMAHLIANLQIYIQLDVIESNYKALEDRVAAAHDFAEAERAHAAFLHALVNQCFLNTATITRAIGAVFVQVQELCGMVDAYVRIVTAGRPPGDALEALARLPQLHASFSQSVNHLYTYLQSSRLQDANKAPHLRQLYLRLNFNNYVGSNMTQRLLQA